MNRPITSGLKSVTGCEVVKSNIANAHLFHRIRISHLRSSGLKPKRHLFRCKWYEIYPSAPDLELYNTGNKDNDAQHIALLAKDWLEEAGRIDPNDGGVVVQKWGIYLTETRCLQSDMSSGRDLMWCSR